MRVQSIRAIGLSLVLSAPFTVFAKGPPPAPTGIWKSLVRPNAKWTLESTGTGASSVKLLVETYDVRKVDGADVARLRYWNIGVKGKKEDLNGALGNMPGQVAVNEKGAWFLERTDDDAKVGAALKGKPSQPDPPKPMQSTKRKDGKLVDLRKLEKGSVVCVGVGPAKGAGECNDVCFGDFCVSPEAGIVMIEGTYAPNYELFSQAGW